MVKSLWNDDDPKKRKKKRLLLLLLLLAIIIIVIIIVFFLLQQPKQTTTPVPSPTPQKTQLKSEPALTITANCESSPGENAQKLIFLDPERFGGETFEIQIQECEPDLPFSLSLAGNVIKDKTNKTGGKLINLTNPSRPSELVYTTFAGNDLNSPHTTSVIDIPNPHRTGAGANAGVNTISFSKPNFLDIADLSSQPQSCGDGVVQGVEQCDPPNSVDSQNCKGAYVPQPGGGLALAVGFCNNKCSCSYATIPQVSASSSCGDGKLDPNEECDVKPKVGTKTKEDLTYQCPYGSPKVPGLCTDDCTCEPPPLFCGNGWLDDYGGLGIEECDPGYGSVFGTSPQKFAGPGCINPGASCDIYTCKCKPLSLCGDGKLDPGEGCDPGNPGFPGPPLSPITVAPHPPAAGNCPGQPPGTTCSSAFDVNGNQLATGCMCIPPPPLAPFCGDGIISTFGANGVPGGGDDENCEPGDPAKGIKPKVSPDCLARGEPFCGKPGLVVGGINYACRCYGPGFKVGDPFNMRGCGNGVIEPAGYDGIVGTIDDEGCEPGPPQLLSQACIAAGATRCGALSDEKNRCKCLGGDVTRPEEILVNDTVVVVNIEIVEVGDCYNKQKIKVRTTRTVKLSGGAAKLPSAASAIGDSPLQATLIADGQTTVLQLKKVGEDEYESDYLPEIGNLTAQVIVNGQTTIIPTVKGIESSFGLGSEKTKEQAIKQLRQLLGLDSTTIAGPNGLTGNQVLVGPPASGQTITKKPCTDSRITTITTTQKTTVNLGVFGKP
ncbi:MAG TPA: hypothetical protein VJA47_01135, partial [archaeon]|nr:hypothetical protein [archaeon]